MRFLRTALGVLVASVLAIGSAAAAPASPQGLLADLYRGKITIEMCNIDVSSDVRSDLESAIVGVEGVLGFDDEMKVLAFEQMQEGVRGTPPDCSSDHDRLVENVAVAIALFRQLQESREAGPIDILGGLYLTVAVAEYCEIPIDQKVAALIGHDAIDLETSLGISPEESEKRYQDVLIRVRTSAPDCSSASNDLLVMRSVMSDYQAAVNSQE